MILYWYHCRSLHYSNTYVILTEVLQTVQLHVLDFTLWPKAWPAMYASPTVSTLTEKDSKNSEKLGDLDFFFAISCHFMSSDFWMLLETAKWGALYTSCLSVSSSKILDAKCVRCMRDHAGDSATGQSDPNSSPMNSTTWNKAENQRVHLNLMLTMTWTTQAFRTELWENPRNFFRSTCACQSCKATKVLSSIEDNRIVKCFTHHRHRHHGHVQFQRLRQIVRWWRCGSDGMDTPQAWIARSCHV